MRTLHYTCPLLYNAHVTHVITPIALPHGTTLPEEHVDGWRSSHRDDEDHEAEYHEIDVDQIALTTAEPGIGF